MIQCFFYVDKGERRSATKKAEQEQRIFVTIYNPFTGTSQFERTDTNVVLSYENLKRGTLINLSEETNRVSLRQSCNLLADEQNKARKFLFTFGGSGLQSCFHTRL